MKKSDLCPTASVDYWKGQVTRTSWPRIKSPVEKLTVVDLFSGCGGLSLGAFLAANAMRRQFSVEMAIDNWSESMEVYSANFGHFSKRLILGDAIEAFEVRLDPVDVVVAGPPCQGHSDLNNRTRRTDPRNELYRIPAEFTIRNRAKTLVIENVPSVIHAAEGVVHDSFARLLDAGYAAAQLVVDVSNFGIPQKRKRHVLVASLMHSQDELDGLAHKWLSTRAHPAVMDFISDVDAKLEGDLMLRSTKISTANSQRIDYLFRNRLYDLPDSMRPACHRDKAHSYRSMYGRMKPNEPAQTITSGFGSMGQGRFVHPMRRRTITPREAARIQGIPDYFSFASVRTLTGLRDMIANAVPPALGMTLLVDLHCNNRAF